MALEEEHLRALLRNVSDTVTVFDIEGNVTFVGGNPGGTLGRDDDEYLGRSAFSYIHPDDRLAIAAQLAEMVVSPGAERVAEYRLMHADGSWVYCEGVAVNLLHDPEVKGIVLTSRNIQSRKMTELTLRAQARILAAIASGVSSEDALGDVQVLVESWIERAQCSITFEPTNAEMAAAAEEPWGRPLSGVRSGVPLGVLRVEVPAGRIPTEREAALLDTAAHLAAIALERAESEERLAKLALHDPLTGLPNRALLVDRLGTALRRMARHEQSVAVLFLDIDRFKVVNDTFGHAAGDELLVSLAERLQLRVRPGDTVARLGGDEFVVICEEVVDAEHAQAIAKRLEVAMDEPFRTSQGDVVAGGSFGVALATSPDADAATLLREADLAMYRAKSDGRGGVVVFDAMMRSSADARAQLAVDLRQGLARGELVVHYQPVFDLLDGRAVAVEALARWRHPRGDVLLPLEFVGLAERTGLVIPLETELFDRAFSDASRWHDSSITLVLNASPVHMVDADFAARLQVALERHQWPASRLQLDIAERLLIDDDRNVLSTLDSLRSLGVRLVIDDFGTGHSSLGALHRFPVDGVKIDRSFVERLGTGDRDEAMVEAIVAVTRALGLDAIAEGVERAEQVERLRELGCRQAQGYLLGRPVPVDELDIA
jgi:diguanylate cyclase (GGDEF)-like protein/PAS domain S-box-containing protein